MIIALPLVAVAAGALLGAALFHMLPQAVSSSSCTGTTATVRSLHIDRSAT